MKHRRTRTWFYVDGERVRPFNGETSRPPVGPSWSHGFTHFRTESGRVMFCGINWFEDNAVPVRKKP